MESTTAIASPVTETAHAGLNVRKLFVLACLCLATSSMSFALRTSIAHDLQTQVFDPINSLTSAQMLGDAMSYCFLGFAFTVFLGSAVLDFLGMRNMLAICGLSFIGAAVLTSFADRIAPGAGAGRVVGIGMFLNGLGWGSSETVINPLTTAVYPGNKVHRLNVLHAWWPFGMIVGGLLGLAIDGAGLGLAREVRSVGTLPAVSILVLLAGTKFPKTERVAAGVPTGDMFKQIFEKPGFIIWFLAMFLTSAAELAPGQRGRPGAVAHRRYARHHSADLRRRPHVRHAALRGHHGEEAVVRRVAPRLVRAGFAGPPRARGRELAHDGLPRGDDLGHGRLLHVADDAGLGVGALSQGRRVPPGAHRLGGLAVDLFRAAADGQDLRQRQGARAHGGNAAFAAGGDAAYQALSGPAKDAIDAAASTQSFRIVAILPAILIVVFGLIWLKDRAKGGFKPEQI